MQPYVHDQGFRFRDRGGGILGSALAALAAGAGMEPLVLRRPDATSPNADTLRNRGGSNPESCIRSATSPMRMLIAP